MKPGREVAQHAQASERDLRPWSSDAVDVHAKKRGRDWIRGGRRLRTRLRCARWPKRQFAHEQ
jgi:hypothetical protein